MPKEVNSKASRDRPWYRADRSLGKRKEHGSPFLEQISSSSRAPFESTTRNSISRGYELPSPLPCSGPLVTPPIESSLPDETTLEATPPHDHPLSGASANAANQDARNEQLRAVLRLLLRMMGPVDEAELQCMRDWFNEQERVKYWLPDKPLGCAVCYMPISSVEKMAKHLYRAHSPYRMPEPMSCCGCVFSSYKKWQRHTGRDHYKQKILLCHSDYIGLNDGALGISALDEPHFNLVESHTGNNPEAKGRMLNLIANNLPHRPLMVVKRKKGPRINKGIRMVCCGICAAPRSNVQEMALHLNSDHLNHNGFDCPEEDCSEKLRSFDSLKRHVLTAHKSKLGRPRIKVDSKRRTLVDLDMREHSHQMNTEAQPAETNGSSVASSSTSSTSSTSSSSGEGRTLTPSAQPEMVNHPSGNSFPSQQANRDEHMTGNGSVRFDAHMFVDGQQAHLISNEGPPLPLRPPLPLSHSNPPPITSQRHPQHCVIDTGVVHGYSAPPVNPLHSNIAQSQDPYIASHGTMNSGPYTTMAPRMPDNILLQVLRNIMNRCPSEIVERVLSGNPNHFVHEAIWRGYDIRDRALVLLLHHGVEVETLLLARPSDSNPLGPFFSPVTAMQSMSPGTTTGFVSTPTAVFTPQSHLQGSVTGNGIQAGSPFDFYSPR